MGRRDDIRNSIGNDVYLDGKMVQAELKRCTKIWSDFVDHATDGRFKGVIQGYNNHYEFGGYSANEKHIVGPDGDVGAWSSGDMRDTWTMCVADKKSGEVLGWRTFLPNADTDEEYEYDDDLAGQVMARLITIKQAKRSSQKFSEVRMSSELESWIEAGMFDDAIKEAEASAPSSIGRE
jgi:hypothetical protein